MAYIIWVVVGAIMPYFRAAVGDDTFSCPKFYPNSFLVPKNRAVVGDALSSANIALIPKKRAHVTHENLGMLA